VVERHKQSLQRHRRRMERDIGHAGLRLCVALTAAAAGRSRRIGFRGRCSTAAALGGRLNADAWDSGLGWGAATPTAAARLAAAALRDCRALVEAAFPSWRRVVLLGCRLRCCRLINRLHRCAPYSVCRCSSMKTGWCEKGRNAQGYWSTFSVK
jgi:hypothetical protein